jgi:hypothetical protein
LHHLAKFTANDNALAFADAAVRRPAALTLRQRNANKTRSHYARTNMDVAFAPMIRRQRLWMVVALSRGLPVRFKSARFVIVAGEERALVDMLVRMGIADLCCASEMATAQSLCDAGAVDACLVVLPRAVPDDKPGWDARTEAPGRGRIPSLLFAEAATPYVRRAAADAGYRAVIPLAESSRLLYRRIGALLQAGRRQGRVMSSKSRAQTPGVGGTLAFGPKTFGPGKLKLQ